VLKAQALQNDATMKEAAKLIVDGMPKRVTERKSCGLSGPLSGRPLKACTT